MSQRPPCRFEVVQIDVSPPPQAQREEEGGAGGEGGVPSGATGVTVVLDAAHNPPAVVRFFDKVRVLCFCYRYVFFFVGVCECVCVALCLFLLGGGRDVSRVSLAVVRSRK